MVPMRFRMVLASVAPVVLGAAGLLFWDITDALSMMYLGGNESSPPRDRKYSAHKEYVKAA